ncbi:MULTISPECIES: glycosyltransferase family 2 protein [unclassified Thioalkalivibrio]|uniref:glycosyltransferase family 2 protein n=1 Tax=unclassified Thioalkalivibrio TaxID=2621013 RepID=UPI00047578B7|nr:MULTISPECIES: glycosyltransferase family 2 protein [unclassified Thioalkalivibrio]
MLDVVVVNWNGGGQLVEAVETVMANAAGLVGRVVVVDNGSTDGSADKVAGMAGVEVIRAGANLGFGAACNLGAREGGSPYILFLNPDTRVGRESLSVPLAFMERPENSDVGICGIQLRDEADGVSCSCSRFPTFTRLLSGALGVEKLPGFRAAGIKMAEWDHGDTRPVDQVMGAFFLMRRDLFDGLGGFDERFFVYFEEVDLSYRAHQAGWQSVFLADAQAFHAGGGTSRQVKAHRLFYSLRSRLLYGFKHFPRWQAWVLIGITGVAEPLTRTAWCLARRDLAGVRHTWSAYRMLWRGMGRIIRGEGRFAP